MASFRSQWVYILVLIMSPTFLAESGTAKVYVGNLSWNTTDETLRQAFGEFGTVVDSIVMRDRDTGRSRGFGFVTFSNADEAAAAIQGLHEQDLDGRRIKVNLANARPSGASSKPTYGGSGGSYGSGSYGGYGGDNSGSNGGSDGTTYGGYTGGSYS